LGKSTRTSRGLRESLARRAVEAGAKWPSTIPGPERSTRCNRGPGSAVRLRGSHSRNHERAFTQPPDAGCLATRLPSFAASSPKLVGSGDFGLSPDVLRCRRSAYTLGPPPARRIGSRSLRTLGPRPVRTVSHSENRTVSRSEARTKFASDSWTHACIGATVAENPRFLRVFRVF
jgi:hypothetical protein